MIAFLVYTVIGMMVATLSALVVVQFFTDARTTWDSLPTDDLGVIITVSVFFGAIWPLTILFGIPAAAIYGITKLRVNARRAAYDRRQTPRP